MCLKGNPTISAFRGSSYSFIILFARLMANKSLLEVYPTS
jgi:hypothetical protein